jgi:hypothetical protein
VCCLLKKKELRSRPESGRSERLPLVEQLCQEMRKSGSKSDTPHAALKAIQRRRMHLITLPSHFLSPGVTFNSETSLTIHA